MHQVSRRSFIKNTSGAGIALWLGISTRGNTIISSGFPSDVVESGNFTPYILVRSSGAITIFNTKPEMGQGTFQSIPAIIAEEFEVSLDQVIIKNTSGEKPFGDRQRAGGSSSIRTNYTDLRKVGASAREVFVRAGSARWQVDASSCYAEEGKIIH
ncbi:MAG TPA: molybdopterin cofactor-binding domain-containing protein, partial [Puia sp.]|nr:molybdopterin cofactor-binding domain-containing protein [Puia sp.]